MRISSNIMRRIELTFVNNYIPVLLTIRFYFIPMLFRQPAIFTSMSKSRTSICSQFLPTSSTGPRAPACSMPERVSSSTISLTAVPRSAAREREPRTSPVSWRWRQLCGRRAGSHARCARPWSARPVRFAAIRQILRCRVLRGRRRSE